MCIEDASYPCLSVGLLRKFCSHRIARRCIRTCQARMPIIGTLILIDQDFSSLACAHAVVDLLDKRALRLVERIGTMHVLASTQPVDAESIEQMPQAAGARQAEVADLWQQARLSSNESAQHPDTVAPRE